MPRLTAHIPCYHSAQLFPNLYFSPLSFPKIHPLLIPSTQKLPMFFYLFIYPAQVRHFGSPRGNDSLTFGRSGYRSGKGGYRLIRLGETEQWPRKFAAGATEKCLNSTSSRNCKAGSLRLAGWRVPSSSTPAPTHLLFQFSQSIFQNTPPFVI